MAKGRDLPDWFLDEPELLRGEDWYVKAFWACSTDRDFGQVLGTIPWSSVQRYGRSRGLTQAAIDALWVVIHAMDEGYLDRMAKEHKKEVERQESRFEEGLEEAGRPETTT